MGKKMLFVFNPHAGKSKIKPKLADIIDEFVKGGYWVTSYTTQCVADAQEVVREHANEYDIVVCSGGDGTLNEVVNGVLDSGADIPIGYIPAGSTNDYGRSLGISQDMMKSARVVINGTEFHSDLGILNGKSFVYVAAFGAFTEVSYQTSQQMKNMLGHSAYILKGVQSLASIKSYHMNIKIDDKIIEDDFIYGMISNTVSVGGFKTLTGKEVALDDGLFEVMLIRKPANPLELQEILTSLMIENFDSKNVYKYKAGRIVIKSDAEVAWTLDGEYGGDHSLVEIRNLKQAFTIKIDEERMKLPTEQLLLDEFEVYGEE